MSLQTLFKLGQYEVTSTNTVGDSTLYIGIGKPSDIGVLRDCAWIVSTFSGVSEMHSIGCTREEALLALRVFVTGEVGVTEAEWATLERLQPKAVDSVSTEFGDSYILLRFIP